jgi:hypothetical protein
MYIQPHLIATQSIVIAGVVQHHRQSINHLIIFIYQSLFTSYIKRAF